MYSISSLGEMIADETRTDAYLAALQRAIVPNQTTVLDIGTGTGIFALMACQFGAAHVYALDPSDAIHVARQIARENGCAERITFIQDFSTFVSLPKPVDVVISDLRGILPYFQQHIPSIIDARQRHLAPGGVLIPEKDRMWATVVSAPAQYESDFVKPWIGNKYNLHMEAARRAIVNQWDRGKVAPSHFLASPQICATLDYNTITATDLTTTIRWTVEQSGIGHGLCIWFDAQLTECLSISNAPGMPPLVYGNAFFPWLEPIGLNAGDTVQVTLRANLIADDYIWRWATQVIDGKQPECIKAGFRQSTFYSSLLSPVQLAKSNADHIVSLTEEGKIDAFILGQMDGKRSVGDIAEALLSQFPSQFLHRNDALGRVGKLSQKYGQDV